jgi:UDP-N-acetyl-D-mannosaminuronic acid dehydrogenase
LWCSNHFASATRGVVRPILERSGLKAGSDFHLAYSPERVLPGQILRELIENARVIGGIDVESSQAGRDLYATFVRGEIILTDATTAEMVKLMENTTGMSRRHRQQFGCLAERFGVITRGHRLANRHPACATWPGVRARISVDLWRLVKGPRPDQADPPARVNDAAGLAELRGVRLLLDGLVRGGLWALL